MVPEFLHISRSDVQALGIGSADIRTALRQAFDALRAGQIAFQPKSQLSLGPGHIFQTLMAVSHQRGVAALKWVGMGPEAGAQGLAAVSALICLNDLATGHPLAVLDGEEITLLRTAGLSALAAESLAPPSPVTLGFVGAGAQARSHLRAFVDLFPSLSEVLCLSRSPASSEVFAKEAAALGLKAAIARDAKSLCAQSDIVISTVPAGAGLQPSLDGRWMKPQSLAVMVDLGRSWHPEGFAAFDLIATDTLAQMPHPIDAKGAPMTHIACRADLEGGLIRTTGRQAFCFRGHPAGDLALALTVHDLMRARGLGQPLQR